MTSLLLSNLSQNCVDAEFSIHDVETHFGLFIIFLNVADLSRGC